MSYTNIKMQPELNRMLEELDSLLPKIAAHKKVFLFFLSQVRQFIHYFGSIQGEFVLTSQQVDTLKTFASIARQYQQLCSEHFSHCWAHSVLENPINYVPTELCSMSTILQESAKSFTDEASGFFDPTAPQWIQYHLLDLKAINASLSQYLRNPAADKDVLAIMTEKSNAIISFVQQYESESVTSGIKVFSPIPLHYQTWRLSASDLQISKEIGKGVSAHVYLGVNKKTGEQVAIKQLRFKKLTGVKLKAFQRELTVLASVSHSCLLRFVGATDTPPFCIVTEWMPRSTLHNDLNKYHSLTPTDRLIAAFDIARGMQYLHSRQIIHRDLKSLNVLLDSNGRAKICDFGLARVVDENERMTDNIGTPHWMAPELLQPSQGYDFKVDVYAYGIVLWEILTSQIPYDGLMATQIIAQVLMSDFRPQIPSNTHNGFRNLIEECWDRDPSKRPSFVDIIKRFLKGDIYMEGVDKRKALDYMSNSFDNDKEIMSSTIQQQINNVMAEFDESKIECLIRTLEVEGIPSEESSQCWDIIQKIDSNKYPGLISSGLVLFLQTVHCAQAAAVLRSLPIDSIPQSAVLKIVSYLPSGSDTIDSDLLIAACRNKGAGHALLHVVSPLHQKIALEVIGIKGTSEDLENDVADICAKVINSDDPMLVTAALRCLISIQKVRRIKLEQLKSFMQSHCKPLVIVSHAAAAELSLEGVKISTDLFDLMLDRWCNDKLASCVVMAALTDVDISKYFLNSIISNSKYSTESALKALAVISKHVELKAQIKIVLKDLIPRITIDKDSQEAQKLLVSVS